MRFQHNSWLISAFALLTLPGYSQVKRQTQVEKISISSQGPLQLQVQTSAPVSPQAQVISNPDRLIIDIPAAVPGAALRALSVNRNQVKRVRVGLFSSSPPVTRIVLDLDSPKSYGITSVASGFTVNLGVEQPDATDDSDSPPIIGWVASSGTAARTARASAPVVKTISSSTPAPGKGVRVQFTKGRLEIHAHNATLSEVLFEIQKQTGAEIAIPAGTEQEHVFVDAGPGPASQVLAELLNGSSLNFVVVGSEADPNVLRSVILSRRTGFAEYVPSYAPSQGSVNFSQNNVSQNNVSAENPPDMNQPLDENVSPPDEPAPQPQPN
jgi:AMIN domain